MRGETAMKKRLAAIVQCSPRRLHKERAFSDASDRELLALTNVPRLTTLLRLDARV